MGVGGDLVGVAAIELAQFHVQLLLKFVGTDVAIVDAWLDILAVLETLHLVYHVFAHLLIILNIPFLAITVQ